MKKLLGLILILGATVLILSACGKRLEITNGDRVTLMYDSFSKDGNIIEKNQKTILIVGLGQSFPAFEIELLGMKKGETKQFEATSENGYAIRHDNSKIQWIGPEIFHSLNIEPKEGEAVSLGTMDGIVIEVDTNNIIVDFNP
ncbi:MAG TPA: FKBP-type peptidyl-prolyl cis-trans isomerase, partial [Candidatus Absconditabacterales bacterium]|nr:FKBP-type peptidyl-prolyl cis-trans isomerase [Candidatus Absconditabacterales bacterium]HPK28229.1 FKBP-type peptidyl-prolyl cis-trans isomerase [Candidatus Absconditabacterales bacterium]